MLGVVVSHGSSVLIRVAACPLPNMQMACSVVGIFVFHDDDVGDVVWCVVCPWLCHDEVWLVVVLCVEVSESDFAGSFVESQLFSVEEFAYCFAAV